MMFINANASSDEIIKSGEEVNASLYGDIIYEGLDLLRYGKFTRKVSERSSHAPKDEFHLESFEKRLIHSKHLRDRVTARNNLKKWYYIAFVQSKRWMK
jgi:hypothetical protein